MIRLFLAILGRLLPLVVVAFLFVLVRCAKAPATTPTLNAPSNPEPIQVNVAPPEVAPTPLPEPKPEPAPKPASEAPAPAAEAAGGSAGGEGDAAGFRFGLALSPAEALAWGCIPLTLRKGVLHDPSGKPFEGARTFRLKGANYGIPADLDRKLVALLKPHVPEKTYRVDIRLGPNRTVTLLRVYAASGLSRPNKHLSLPR